MSDIPLDPTSARKSPDLSGLLSKAWLNGQLLNQNSLDQVQSPTFSVDDRAAQFGDGVFESIFLQEGQAPLLDKHLNRLIAGLSQLKIALDQQALIADIMLAIEHSLAFPEQKFRLKVRVSRGESRSGYGFSDTLVPNRIIEISPLTYSYQKLQQGVDVALCDWRLSSQPALVNIKHLNRLDQVMAKLELQERAKADLDSPDFFDALLCDQQGFVTEGSMANLFWLDEHMQWHTPIIDQAGLNGVMKQSVMDLAAGQGINIQASRLSVEQLRQVKALAMTNALAGFVPVNSITINTEQIALNIAADEAVHRSVLQLTVLSQQLLGVY